MKTTANNNEMMTKAINHAENMISVCNKQIEYLTHPETYGCCLSKCNSIVINKERMMTVTTDETHRTTYEFSPLYPTYFSPEKAREIVENDIYKQRPTNQNGNRRQTGILPTAEGLGRGPPKNNEKCNMLNQHGRGNPPTNKEKLWQK